MFGRTAADVSQACMRRVQLPARRLRRPGGRRIKAADPTFCRLFADITMARRARLLVGRVEARPKDIELTTELEDEALAALLLRHTCWRWAKNAESVVLAEETFAVRTKIRRLLDDLLYQIREIPSRHQ